MENIENDSKQIPVFKSANMSYEINFMVKLLKECARNLVDSDIEIIEVHHNNEVDSPSGTALELEKYIRKKFDGEIKISAIREGEEMGEHKVVAIIGDEKLMITHNVYSRNAFVRGVVDEIKTLLN